MSEEQERAEYELFLNGGYGSTSYKEFLELRRIFNALPEKDQEDLKKQAAADGKHHLRFLNPRDWQSLSDSRLRTEFLSTLTPEGRQEYEAAQQKSGLPPLDYFRQQRQKNEEEATANEQKTSDRLVDGTAVTKAPTLTDRLFPDNDKTIIDREASKNVSQVETQRQQPQALDNALAPTPSNPTLLAAMDAAMKEGKAALTKEGAAANKVVADGMVAKGATVPEGDSMARVEAEREVAANQELVAQARRNRQDAVNEYQKEEQAKADAEEKAAAKRKALKQMYSDVRNPGSSSLYAGLTFGMTTGIQSQHDIHRDPNLKLEEQYNKALDIVNNTQGDNNLHNDLYSLASGNVPGDNLQPKGGQPQILAGAAGQPQTGQGTTVPQGTQGQGTGAQSAAVPQQGQQQQAASTKNYGGADIGRASNNGAPFPNQPVETGYTQESQQILDNFPTHLEENLTQGSDGSTEDKTDALTNALSNVYKTPLKDPKVQAEVDKRIKAGESIRNIIDNYLNPLIASQPVTIDTFKESADMGNEISRMMMNIFKRNPGLKITYADTITFVNLNNAIDHMGGYSADAEEATQQREALLRILNGSNETATFKILNTKNKTVSITVNKDNVRNFEKDGLFEVGDYYTNPNKYKGRRHYEFRYPATISPKIETELKKLPVPQESLPKQPLEQPRRVDILVNFDPLAHRALGGWDNTTNAQIAARRQGREEAYLQRQQEQTGGVLRRMYNNRNEDLRRQGIQFAAAYANAPRQEQEDAMNATFFRWKNDPNLSPDAPGLSHEERLIRTEMLNNAMQSLMGEVQKNTLQVQKSEKIAYAQNTLTTINDAVRNGSMKPQDALRSTMAQLHDLRQFMQPDAYNDMYIQQIGAVGQAHIEDKINNLIKESKGQPLSGIGKHTGDINNMLASLFGYAQAELGENGAALFSIEAAKLAEAAQGALQAHNFGFYQGKQNEYEYYMAQGQYDTAAAYARAYAPKLKAAWDAGDIDSKGQHASRNFFKPVIKSGEGGGGGGRGGDKVLSIEGAVNRNMDKLLNFVDGAGGGNGSLNMQDLFATVYHEVAPHLKEEKYSEDEINAGITREILKGILKAKGTPGGNSEQFIQAFSDTETRMNGVAESMLEEKYKTKTLSDEQKTELLDVRRQLSSWYHSMLFDVALQNTDSKDLMVKFDNLNYQFVLKNSDIFTASHPNEYKPNEKQAAQYFNNAREFYNETGVTLRNMPSIATAETQADYEAAAASQFQKKYGLQVTGIEPARGRAIIKAVDGNENVKHYLINPDKNGKKLAFEEVRIEKDRYGNISYFFPGSSIKTEAAK